MNNDHPSNITETRFFFGPRKKQYSTKPPTKIIPQNVYEAPTNDIYQNSYQSTKQFHGVNNGFSNTRFQRPDFFSTLDNSANIYINLPRTEPQYNNYDTNRPSPSIEVPNSQFSPNYNNPNNNDADGKLNSNTNWNPTSNSYYGENSGVGVPGQYGKNSNSRLPSKTGNGNTRLDNINYSQNNFVTRDVVYFPNENKIPNTGISSSNPNRPSSQGNNWGYSPNTNTRPNNGNSIYTGSQNGNQPTNGNVNRLTTTKRSISDNDEPIWGTTERTTTRKTTNVVNTRPKPVTDSNGSQQFPQQRTCERSKQIYKILNRSFEFFRGE